MLSLIKWLSSEMLLLNTLQEYHTSNSLVGNPKVAQKSREVVSVNNDECHTAPRRQSNMAFSPKPSFTDELVFDIKETVNHSRDHLN